MNPLVRTWPETGNETSDLLAHKLVINPLSHTSLGSLPLNDDMDLVIFKFSPPLINRWKRKNISGIYSQGGGVGKHVSPLHTTIAKNTATMQNKYHPELSEKLSCVDV